MKKLFLTVLVLTLPVLVLTGCTSKETTNKNTKTNETQEETKLEGNNQKVKLISNIETKDMIEITFNEDRFAIEEYFLTEPQDIIYFTDKSNGNTVNIFVDDVGDESADEYYNRLVANAKKNIKTDEVEISEMENVKYGGITFKKFSASWKEDYKYNSKEDGKLVEGTNENEETAIFAEIDKGLFLRYSGPIDDDILNNLFVKIKK